MPEVIERLLDVPVALSLDERTAFRDAAVRALDTLPASIGRLVLDCSRTGSVDSAGLSALIAIQRHAAGRQQSVRLRGVSAELRFLLLLTKLAELFELEDDTPS